MPAALRCCFLSGIPFLSAEEMPVFLLHKIADIIVFHTIRKTVRILFATNQSRDAQVHQWPLSSHWDHILINTTADQSFGRSGQTPPEESNHERDRKKSNIHVSMNANVYRHICKGT